MNKTTYIILTIIILLIVGGILVYRKSPESNLPQPALEVTIPGTGTYSPQPSPQPTPQPTEEQKNTNNGIHAPKAKEYTIIINSDSGYSPSTITVKKGETVTWKNESAQETWPASAMHPTHAVYPIKGGCIGSTFDACKGFKKGESWSFTFDAVGTWKYHDHLNPSHFGTIIVK